MIHISLKKESFEKAVEMGGICQIHWPQVRVPPISWFRRRWSRRREHTKYHRKYISKKSYSRHPMIRLFRYSRVSGRNLNGKWEPHDPIRLASFNLYPLRIGLLVTFRLSANRSDLLGSCRHHLSVILSSDGFRLLSSVSRELVQ